METNPSQAGGNRTPFTDLEEQNQSKEQQIIELEKTIKENQKIIDGQANTVIEKEKKILELKTEKETKAHEVEQLKSGAQEKEKKIVELQLTNSKLIDPTQIVTVQQLREYASCMDPLELLEKKILVTRSLHYGGNDEWLADGFEIDFDDEDYKIYIQSILSIKSLPADQFPALIEHLCPNNFDWLHLIDLTISFVDYKNLVGKGNIAILEIHKVTVRNEDGTVITADQLLKEVPNAIHFNYMFNDGEKMEGLAEKFDQLPLFSKLPCLDFSNVQEGIDLKKFGQFLQKNVTGNRSILLHFNVAKETFAKMEQIKEEINLTLPPTFYFKIFDEKEFFAEIAQLKSESQKCKSQEDELQTTTSSKLINPHDLLTVYEYTRVKSMDPDKKFQNKTLLTFRMDYINMKWLIDGNVKFYFDDSNFKIFVQDSLVLNGLPASKFTPLIERLHSKSFRELYLTDLTMSFADYKNLVGESNIRKLGIHRVTVTNENGIAITVDQLMKEVPNINFFNYTFNDDEKMDGIAQKLIELPRFANLQTFQLLNIPEGFDSEVFGQFVKKNAIKDKSWVLRFKKEMDSNLQGNRQK